jgi:hypothetical protein
VINNGASTTPSDISPELRLRILNSERLVSRDRLRRRTQVPAAARHHDIWSAIQTFLEPVDFAGKTVLVIGCWDGQWSFLAENRGAARLLATDDCSQHWTSLGDRIGINLSPAPGLGFQLAKKASPPASNKEVMSSSASSGD